MESKTVIQGEIQELNIFGWKCQIYLPFSYATGKYRFPVVYINGEADMVAIIEELEGHFDIDCEPMILVNIISNNWGADFTPWPAPSIDKKGEKFTGEANKYLKSVIHVIKPFVDINYRTKPDVENTCLIGYSLGGLTALYALYNDTNTFGRIGCMSGSLWYDGWTKYMEENKILNTNVKVYLSVGRNEELSKNARIATIGMCFDKAKSLLLQEVKDPKQVFFEINQGGHFTDISHRHFQALLWLMNLDK